MNNQKMASPFERPEKPPCECRVCARSFRTLEQQKQPAFRYSRSLRGAEAMKTVQDLLMNIRNDFRFINKQVEHSGELIIELWRKKTRLKRYVELNYAMGDYELRRELTLWRKNPDEKPELPRKAFLLNHLTMSRLTIEPDRFLALLFGRAMHHPSEWAICDNQRLEWVWKSGLVKTEFSKLMLNIEMGSPQFCRLVNWQPDSCKRRLTVGFPRAILLLEAQQTIMTLLKTVVNALLSEGLPDFDYVEPFIWSRGFKNDSQEELWCSYLNQPLTEPRVFREYEMVDISGRKLSLVEEHLRCLQTNSEYLQRMVFQIAAAVGFTQGRDIILREAVAGISYDIWNYWSWKLISVACRNILHQRIEFGSSRSAWAKEVSFLKYQAAFHELSVLLNEQCTERASYIPLLLSSRAAFSRYFTTNTNEKEELVEVSLNEQLLEEARKDDLFPLLWDISYIPRERQPTEVDLDTVLALLEDRTRTLSTQRERIDERLYNCLSDLAAVHDLQSRLELRRPAPDRKVAREFLNGPDLNRSGYRIILTSQARKIRDNEFKDFAPPDFDDRSQALLRFLKVASLQLKKMSVDKVFDSAPDAMDIFWEAVREHRCMVFEYAVRAKRSKWTEDAIEADMDPISKGDDTVFSAEEFDQVLMGHPDPGVELLVSSRPKDVCEGHKPLCVCDPCDKRRRSYGSLYLPPLEHYTDMARLIMIIIPVKAAWASIIEAASVQSTATEPQCTLHWQSFVAFMQDIGFEGRTTYFDCIFEQVFAKRVFLGKGQGNNIGPWKRGTMTFAFRKPPQGSIDSVMLRVMLSRLGRMFEENGIRVKLLRRDKWDKVKNDEYRRVRRTSYTPPPEPDCSDEEEDNEDSEEEEANSGEGDDCSNEEEDNEDSEMEEDDAAEEGDHCSDEEEDNEDCEDCDEEDSSEEQGADEEEDDDAMDVDMDMGDETGMTQQPAEQEDEDVDMEMSDGEITVMSEASTPEPAEPEVDFTALQAQLHAQVEEAEANQAQEAQDADSTEETLDNEDDEVDEDQEPSPPLKQYMLRPRRRWFE